MTVVSFKSDRRIEPDCRRELRAFASEAGRSVQALAERLGVRVNLEELPDDTSAVLIKSKTRGGSSGYRIAVNRHHSLERQRFSIAHELGHFALHRNDPEFKAINESDNYADVVPLFDVQGNSFRSANREVRVSRLEWEADQFASNLLMPEHLLRKSPNFRLGAKSNLAREFCVSMSAIDRRLKTLSPIGAKRERLQKVA